MMGLASPGGSVLIVDDEPGLCLLVATALQKRGFEAIWTTSATEALEMLLTTEVDTVVADVEMPGMSGLELCERLAADRPDLPVVILTGSDALPTAIEAIRAGAFDFLTKPPGIESVVQAVERAIRQRRLRVAVRRLQREMADPGTLVETLGTSRPMQELARLLARVAGCQATVLITGETGTGKEVVARLLHALGQRSAGPFVAVNCSALPAPLLESELFGHVRGAFTDARADRTGLFAQAQGGTLFLDEIGEMPLALQPKLLRAIQERTIRPVGGTAEIRCDVRLIAATNRDLEAAVRVNEFREDLFFRLNVLPVSVPPLRERGSDILMLAQRFLERHAKAGGRPVTCFTPAAAERLLAYPWPGNVRELENVVERTATLASYDQIGVMDLPPNLHGAGRQEQAEPGPGPGPGPRPDTSLEELERQHILHVLDSVDGNRTAAARMLGMDRKTLYRKLLRYGVSE